MVSELVRRWGMIQAATFLFTVGIKTAELSCLLQLGLVDLVEPQGVLQSWLTATRNLLIYLVLNPAVLTAAYAGAASVWRFCRILIRSNTQNSGRLMRKGKLFAH